MKLKGKIDKKKGKFVVLRCNYAFFTVVVQGDDKEKLAQQAEEQGEPLPILIMTVTSLIEYIKVREHYRNHKLDKKLSRLWKEAE